MNSLRNLSISRSILAFITAIVLIILVLWGVYTFVIFSGTTNDVVESSSREINKQIIMNYESYIFDVIDVANFVTESTLSSTEDGNLEALSSVYETMDQSNSYIATITLLNSNGSRIMSSEKDKLHNNDLDTKSWFKIALRDSEIYHFSSSHIEDVYRNGTHEVITFSKAINYVVGGTETVGVLVIELEVSGFYQLTEVTNLGANGHIIITDENYRTVFTNSSPCEDSDCDSIDIMKDIILGGSYVNSEDVNMYVNINTISLTRWRIATFINAEQIQAARNQVLISFVIASVLAFMATIIVSSLFSKRITSPIYKLNEYMIKFQKGSLDSKIEVQGQKELVELSESFNSMIDEISSLMSEVMREQKAKRKTQFIALQNQINPHFLYNTLDSILHLNDNKRSEDVEKMIVALSKFFRSSISTERNIIPLKEEIEHVKNYLLIQKIRYSNRFNYHFDIDESLMEFPVLKLGLQPIVENAILHGINPEKDDNSIIIRTVKDEDFVYVEVENNGYGITQYDIEKIYSGFLDTKSSKHIGLNNINQRLQLYYGEKAKISIISEPDEYTIVRMVFPINRGEDI